MSGRWYKKGFSEKVVEVGKTTAEDLEWWFRDVMRLEGESIGRYKED